ncbi:MAG: MFS transporter [Vicinamibacterales bacterium]
MSSLATLILCTVAALLEGFDNQSMGVAAPRLVPEFGLSASAASWIFSATTMGLFIGAGIGGRVADRWGRHRTLALSMLLFGLFSFLTTLATGPQSLFVARLVTGLGLGGAMPNFIAMASEATHSSRRLTSVTVVMAGMPFGGLLAGGVMLLVETLGWPWRTIFYIGAVAPVLLAFVIWRLSACVPSAQTTGAAPAAEALGVPVALPSTTSLEPVSSVLFGRGRALTTVEIWGGFFFTQLVLLLMLNWLPSLFVGLGFSRSQASVASMCFNFFGAASSLVLGRLHAGQQRRLWVLLTYCGMAVALGALPMAGHSFGLAVCAVAFAGVFIIGAQLVLFALAPLYYEQPIRGTGVGAAVSIGRLGSVLGPLYAGALLAGGGGSATVLIGIIPFVVAGGASAFALCWRPQRGA